MATQKTKKQVLEEQIEQMMAIPSEYYAQREKVLANTDYTLKYKSTQLETLDTEYSEKFKQAGEAVTLLLKEALDTLTDERKEAMSKRAEQSYLLQLQNAMSTLELVGGGLSQEDLQALIQPFEADSIAMATLQKVAIKGGMDSDRANKDIAYAQNPAIGVLEGLIKVMGRMSASRVDADSDNFAFTFALSQLSDQLTSDLRDRNML